MVFIDDINNQIVRLMIMNSHYGFITVTSYMKRASLRLTTLCVLLLKFCRAFLGELLVEWGISFLFYLFIYSILYIYTLQKKTYIIYLLKNY